RKRQHLTRANQVRTTQTIELRQRRDAHAVFRGDPRQRLAATNSMLRVGKLGFDAQALELRKRRGEVDVRGHTQLEAARNVSSAVPDGRQQRWVQPAQ